jgi:hypothetical protein
LTTLLDNPLDNPLKLNYIINNTKGVVKMKLKKNLKFVECVKEEMEKLLSICAIRWGDPV